MGSPGKDLHHRRSRIHVRCLGHRPQRVLDAAAGHRLRPVRPGSGAVATANLIGMAVGAIVWGTHRRPDRPQEGLQHHAADLRPVLRARRFLAELEVFLALRFLAGFGLGGCIPVDYALVSEFSPERSAARSCRRWTCWWPIGATFGVVARSSSPLDGDVALAIMLLIMVLPALLLFWVRRGIPESRSTSPRGPRGRGPRSHRRHGRANRCAVVEYVRRSRKPNRARSRRRCVAGRDAAQVRLGFSPGITATAWMLFVSIMLRLLRRPELDALDPAG